MHGSLDESIIGKGTWIDKVAFAIIERERKLERSTSTIRVESGLGASGIPHIGSMGDAVRAFGISLALQNQGHNSELIAFSDDLDGLRKVPAGMPEWLNDYLCKPVSSIPDPYGDCHYSYGAHMSGLLLDGLDRVGVNYTFKSATDVYKSGKLFDQVHDILVNSKTIGDKIEYFTGQQKYKDTIPFFPICQQCGRLYVAIATDYFPDKRTVGYSCIGNTINRKPVKGCGHKGEAKIGNGEGKLAWKVEFAARWKAFDIRFEAFGKDIMDSVVINDWISSEILHFHHPLHVKYEMFLDKIGKKISKSAGNVFTPQMWLRYGSPQSIMLLLYKRIAGTRSVSVIDIPNLMDEYDFYEDLYFGKLNENNKNKLAKIKGIYEYVNHLNPPKTPQVHIPYRILLQQAELFTNREVNAIEKIYERLNKYGIIKNQDPAITAKMGLAINWAKDFAEEDEYYDGIENNGETAKTSIEGKHKKALSEALNHLRRISEDARNSSTNEDNDKLGQSVQTIIFSTAKENSIEPKDLFRLFYKILINAERGPRLGNYIVDLGIEKVIGKIEKKLKSL